MILAGTFLSLLDWFIVNVAIPSIQSGLHASFSQAELVVAGYGISYAVLLVTGGRLGDMVGRKRMFVGGMLLFVVASALCGLAPSIDALIAMRVFQGGAAAVMFPQVLALVRVTFSGRERARAMGIYGAAMGLAMIGGQVLGGLLIHLDILGLTWRPVFLVNVPVGLLACLLTIPLVRESRSSAPAGLDLVGVVLASLSVVLLVVPLAVGPGAGWPAWTVGSLLLTAPSLALFVGYERYLKGRGGSPLLELSLLRVRTFLVGLLVVLAFFPAPSMFFLVLAVFLQQGLGFDALASGLTAAPFAIGFLAASLAAIRLGPRLGRGLLSTGVLLMALGNVMVLGTASWAGAGLQGWMLAPALVVVGLGQGSVITPLVGTVISGVPPAYAGAAAGLLSTVQQVGGAIGSVMAGLVFMAAVSASPASGAARYVDGLRPAELAIVAGFLLTWALLFLLPKRASVVLELAH